MNKYYGVKRLRFQWAVRETHSGEIYGLYESQTFARFVATRLNNEFGYINL